MAKRRRKPSALALARWSQGLTQEDLAKRSGVAQSAICMIERGHRTPSVRTAIKLAVALGRSVEDLWPDLVPKVPPTGEEVGNG